MNSLTAHQTFTLARINRHSNFYPRLYVKEQPSYRFMRTVLTKLGVASFLLLTFLGVGVFLSFSMLLN